MKNIWVQFIIMGPIKLLKKLKQFARPSSTILIPEMQNDLKIPPSFRVVYPPNYDPAKRDYNKWIENIYGY